MTHSERAMIKDLYNRYGWKCFACGKPVAQRAHLISNSKASKKRFGAVIVDSPLNWLPACSLECNALIDVGHASDLPNKIADAIKANDREEIERLVRENIERKLGKRNER